MILFYVNFGLFCNSNVPSAYIGNVFQFRFSQTSGWNVVKFGGQAVDYKLLNYFGLHPTHCMTALVSS